MVYPSSSRGNTMRGCTGECVYVCLSMFADIIHMQCMCVFVNINVN